HTAADRAPRVPPQGRVRVPPRVGQRVRDARRVCDNSATKRVCGDLRRPADLRHRLALYGASARVAAARYNRCNLLMYLDFEDYRPNIEPVGRALTGLEVVLLSIVFHLSMLVLLLVAPRVFPNLFRVDPARAQAALLAAERQAQPRFVFVATRNDLTAPKAPPRAEASDKDRTARSPESAKNPTNPLPFSRGNTPERVEAQTRQAARGEGPAPSPAPGQPAQSSSDTQSDAQSALQLPAKSGAQQSNVTGHA